MSTAMMEVLEVDELKVPAVGGYSNAQADAQCERDNVEVAAPIKRGAISTDFFRPTHFTYDEGSDTIRCPAGETLRPSGKHTGGGRFLAGGLRAVKAESAPSTRSD
jgi:hypothetical protein